MWVSLYANLKNGTQSHMNPHILNRSLHSNGRCSFPISAHHILCYLAPIPGTTLGFTSTFACDQPWVQSYHRPHCSGWAWQCPDAHAGWLGRSRTWDICRRESGECKVSGHIFQYYVETNVLRSHHPARVMEWSTMVPGGGFSGPLPACLNILVEILFCTTHTASLGL